MIHVFKQGYKKVQDSFIDIMEKNSENSATNYNSMPVHRILKREFVYGDFPSAYV